MTRKKQTPTRVATYCRTATPDADEGTASIERQMEACREYLREKGYQEGKVYQDLNASSFDDHRPAYQQLLRDIDAGEVDVVVTSAPDKLTRKPEHLADFLKVTDRNGCRIETAQTGTWHHNAKMLVIGMEWAKAEWAKEAQEKRENNR